MAEVGVDISKHRSKSAMEFIGEKFDGSTSLFAAVIGPLVRESRPDAAHAQKNLPGVIFCDNLYPCLGVTG